MTSSPAASPSLSWLGAGCLVCAGPHGPLCAGCWRGLEAPPVGPIRGVGPVPCLFAYSGRGQDVIRCLKYRDGRRLLCELADPLADLLPPSASAISWVPTSPQRRRRRGYDQAELLARSVARRAELPVVELLARRSGPNQTGRSATARQRGVAFRVRGRSTDRTASGPVVLIDDVVTTGATLRAAAGVLDSAGVAARYLALARTP